LDTRFFSILQITGLLPAAGCTTAQPQAIPPGKISNAAQQAPRSPTGAELRDTIAGFDAYTKKSPAVVTGQNGTLRVAMGKPR